MTLTFPYRIYPAWFGGEDKKGMIELAHYTADRMGFFLSKDAIRITGTGFDRRGGHFVDFTVTYNVS